MGKLTRRVKFIARERRLSIPAEFLHAHAIERGGELVLCVYGERLYAFSPTDWARIAIVVALSARLFPESDHPLMSLARSAVTLRLGSQDRIVLPRDFPFEEDRNVRMHWELVEGVLQLDPELAASTARLAEPADSGQRSLLDLLAANRPVARFDRGEQSARLVEDVSVGRIDWRDRSFSEDGGQLPDALLRSVRVEGVRRPIVLREAGDGYQVIDGAKRLQAARALRLKSIPALVFRGVGDDDCRRLRLIEEPRPTEAHSPLQRLQSAVRLHEDQVALNEIEQITGRRKRTLQRYLRIAQEGPVRDAVAEGRLSIFKAEEILKAGIDPRRAIDEAWSVRQIRDAGSRIAEPRPSRRHAPDV